MAHLLVVDDEKSICELLEITFRKAGHKVETATSVQLARRKIESQIFDIIISDIRLNPDSDDASGVELLKFAKEVSPSCVFILITGVPDQDTAIDAVNFGADRYVIKGNRLTEELRQAVRQAAENQTLKKEAGYLRRELRRVTGLDNIIGQSPKMRAIFELIETVAPQASRVLITGESGTGKELVAQAIHGASGRGGGPFMPINCAAIPADLLESELFGHTKGAYTGAVASTEGLIREAHGGTLFLDEISELAPALQVKLLRVIQEKQVRPLGSKSVYNVDVRFLATTNRDLKAAMEHRLFRADLFYRLNVINIHVPPLRERGGDVEILAQHFIEQHSRQLGKRITGMARELKDFLHTYQWPGNVRELENLIERAVILVEGELLSCKDLTDIAASDNHDGRPAEFTGEALAQALPVEKYIEEFVRRYQSHYSESELAALLGIGRKALWVRRNRWGLKRNADRRLHQRAPEATRPPGRAD